MTGCLDKSSQMSKTSIGAPTPFLGSVGVRGGNEAPDLTGQKKWKGQGLQSSTKGKGSLSLSLLRWKVMATATERSCSCCSKTASHLATAPIPSPHRQEGLHKPKQPVIISSSPGRPGRQLQAYEVGSGLLFQGPELALLFAS